MTPARSSLLLVALGLAPIASAQTTVPGLIATYSEGGHQVLMVAPAAQFYLAADESVHPSLGPGFEAEWKGLLSIVRAGNYRFDYGDAQVSVDGRALAAEPITLTAGMHPITIRYRRKPGVARLRLQWEAAHFLREPVPGSAFFHDASQAAGGQDTRIERGRTLVEEFGCVNCHAAGFRGRAGPDLNGIGSRVNGGWLVRWLENPQAFRSAAVMPAVSGEQERRDIAAYLGSLRATSPARKLRRIAAPDIARGTTLYGLLGCSACHQQEGLDLEGLGSKTTIEPLIDFLKEPARFDPGGRMPSLLLTDEEALQLAAFLLQSRNPAFEAAPMEGDAERGRTLLASQGCLACHDLRNSAPMKNTQRAPALAKLSSAAGCLADVPPPHLPRYHLSAADREAIQSFLAAYRLHPDRSPAPVYQLHRSFEQLRCVACHAADHRQPSAVLAEAAPPLTGVGEKLRTPWIQQVVTGRRRVRQWLALRMPQYDSRAAQPLAEAFAKASGLEPGEGPPAPAALDAQKTRGAAMIGVDAKKGGLACVGCHDWGPHPSLGEEAPQLINVTQRLRYDWYQRWMLDPARILSGTSMPNYFSSMDRERAAETIHALWAALDLGERMPLPDGLEAAKALRDAEAIPIPGREPIVVRWDMPEATPAAIAVGLPGGLSYCFDAGESRLRYAWKGGFIDLTGTLTRKTEPNRLTPTAKIIGEIFYRSGDFPLRFGAQDRIPQRRFRGYRLAAGFPEFHYQAGAVDVRERILPARNNAGLIREFTLDRVDQPAWFIDSPGAPPVEIPQGNAVHFQVEAPIQKGNR